MKKSIVSVNTKHKGFSEAIAVAIFAAGILFAQPAAFASEIIQGEVQSVNKANNTFQLSWINPKSGNSEDATIFISSDSKLKGIQSLEYLHKGSHVRVEANKIVNGHGNDIRGGWNLKAVSVVEMKSPKTQ